MRSIVRGLMAAFLLGILFTTSAFARPFDAGLKHALASPIRNLVVRESVEVCHSQMKQEWPGVRCLVRSVRGFGDLSVAVAVLCFDSPESPRCASRSDNLPRWKPSDAAVVWRIEGDRPFDSRVVAVGSSDEILVEVLGTWATPLGPILVVPLRESGSGNGNLSQWFRIDGHLSKVFDGQTSNIHAERQSRLPPGAFLWKGVWPKPETLGGDHVSVYQESDGNCCPTNGLLSYRLLLRDNELQVAAVAYRPRRGEP